MRAKRGLKIEKITKQGRVDGEGSESIDGRGWRLVGTLQDGFGLVCCCAIIIILIIIIIKLLLLIIVNKK